MPAKEKDRHKTEQTQVRLSTEAKAGLEALVQHFSSQVGVRFSKTQVFEKLITDRVRAEGLRVKGI